MKCANCLIHTTNPKFCSQSCSASFHNKRNPKRKPEGICNGCQAPTSTSRKFCTRCRSQRTKPRGLTSVGELRARLSVAGKHPSWINAHVRNDCRSTHKAMAKLPCALCTYDKHVELAHIRPVSSFPDSSSLAEINAANNVIQLCRNCHWEFDHGLVSLKGLEPLTCPLEAGRSSH